jgi:hypothetical protein
VKLITVLFPCGFSGQIIIYFIDAILVASAKYVNTNKGI